MAMKLSQTKTDPDLERNGVWEEYAAGFRMKIARLSSPAYEQYLQKLLKPYIRQARSGNLEVETRRGLERKAMARHLLLDWDGLEDDDGNAIPYSEQTAIELLESHDIFRFVEEVASDSERYKQQNQEEAEGN